MMHTHTAESILRRNMTSSTNSNPSHKQDSKYSTTHVKLGRLLLHTFASQSIDLDTNISGETIEDRDGQDKHVDYIVNMELSVSCPRRYNEFKELHNILKSRFPHLQLPSLPDVNWRIKLFRRSFDPQHISSKRQQLDAYLKQLAAVPQVRTCPEFLHFIMYSKGFQHQNSFRMSSSTKAISTRELADDSGSVMASSTGSTVLGLSYQSTVGAPDESDTIYESEEITWMYPTQALEGHPLIQRLVTTVLNVTFLDLDSDESILKANVVTIRFPELDTDVDFGKCAFENDYIVSTSAHIDGIDVPLRIRIVDQSPQKDLTGITVIF